MTAAAAVDSGVVTPESMFDCDGKLEVSGLYALRFQPAGARAARPSRKALIVSCNVTFAQVGLLLGAETLVSYAEAFGFNKVIPFDLPTAKSQIQKANTMDPVALAASSIGQAEDLATPLQMALVAATVAKRGRRAEAVRGQRVTGLQREDHRAVQAPEWNSVIDGRDCGDAHRHDGGCRR